MNGANGKRAHRVPRWLLALLVVVGVSVVGRPAQTADPATQPAAAVHMDGPKDGFAG